MALQRSLLLLSLFLLSLGMYSCKPRCPIYSCQVRMLHRHGEQEFRGVPVYKKQNMKMGEKMPRQTGEKADRHNDKSRNKQ